MISAIFATYNEEANIAELFQRLNNALFGLKVPYEIIAVDDGSTDSTLSELKKCKPIRILVLSKNMGQAVALDAGIKNAKGDIVVTLDADLQNDPEDISLLIKKLEEGYDLVSGWRAHRKDSFLRKIISRFANFLIFYVTGLKIKDSAAPLKAVRKENLKGVNLYGGMHSFLPSVLYARGAKITEVAVNHHERKSGESKYRFKQLVTFTSDLFVVKFLSDYFARPFLFFGGFGFLSIILGFIAAIASIVLKIFSIRNFTQTPLPTIIVLFVVSGAILIMMGFLAEILLRIYYETKDRTPYTIKEEITNS